MRDKLSEQRIQLLHPTVRREVKDLIEAAEAELSPRIAVRIVQGHRSIAEQDALYAQGRSKPGKIVTNARGGRSYHNYGLAIDFALLYDTDGNGTWEVLSWDTKRDFDNSKGSDWMQVVKVFEAAGWKWGGRFSKLVDMPHLEKAFGYSWQQLLKKHNEGDFIEKYVRL